MAGSFTVVFRDFTLHSPLFVTKPFSFELLAFPKVASFPIENGLRTPEMSRNKQELFFKDFLN